MIVVAGFVVPAVVQAQALPPLPPELLVIGPPKPDPCAQSMNQAGDLVNLSDLARDCTGAAARPAPQAINPDDAEFLLLQLIIDGIEMQDVIEARKLGDRYFIALSQFALAVDFSVQVDPAATTAKGWFIREQNVFSLSPQEATARGKTVKLGPDTVFSDENDVYLDAVAAQALFPIDFVFDMRRMVIEMTARERLPFQDRLSREKTREQLSQSKDRKPDEVVAKRLDTPYQAFSWPVTDINLNSNYDSKSDVRQSDYSINSVGDFGYLTARLFASGDMADNGLTDARVSLGRDSIDRDLLGPLRASSFRIGDMNSVSISEVASSGQGRGVVVSSRALDRPENFDFTNFIGDSQPGWEVELYRNGALIDSQVIGSDGRYAFENVPVLFGNNQFRLAFYGPQGQVQEIIKTINAESSLLEKGELTYNFSADQKNESVLGVTENDNQVTGFRTAGEIEYGLTRNMTLVMGAARLPLQIGDHDYVTSGIRTSMGGALVSLNSAYDTTNQGYNVRAAVSTELSGTLISIDQSVAKDFFSEQNTLFTNPIERETNVRFDRQFGDLGASLQFSRKIYQDDRVEDRWQNQISKVLFDKINVTHTLQYNRDNASLDDMNGTLFARGYYRNILLGGQYDYDIKPIQKPQSLRLSGLIPVSEKISNNLELRADLQGETDNEISNTVTFDRDKYKISAAVRADEAGEYYAGVSVNLSVGRTPSSGKWFTSSKTLAETCNIAVYPYIDKNFNLRRDADEVAPPETKIRIGSQSYSVDKQGAAVATQLPTSIPVKIFLEPENQQANPFWSAGSEAYSLIRAPAPSCRLIFLFSKPARSMAPCMCPKASIRRGWWLSLCPAKGRSRVQPARLSTVIT